MAKKAVLVFGFLLVAWGCSGGGGGGDNPPAAVSVTLTPMSANVHVTRTTQLTATVRHTTNTALTWTLSGMGCTGSSCGTISNTGLYTAPASVPNPATVTVTATSLADSSKSASAVITILPAVVITVTPLDQEVNIGTTRQYTASIENAVDGAVTWSIAGTGCNGGSCGTISNAGLYMAPAAVPVAPAISITATSVEDPATSRTVEATIVSLVAVTGWPLRAQVAVGATLQFGALVTDAVDPAITWGLAGGGGAGTDWGTLSQTGLYTAPNSVPPAATVTITATSRMDPSRTSAATVRVVASNDAKLNGCYAFCYRGFANNAPAQTAGMFMADGQGQITYGRMDRTWPDYAGGNLLNLAFTGYYTMFGDGRGYLTLEFPDPYGNATLAFVLNAAGDEAFIQPYFDNGTRLLGTMVKQDISVFNNSALNGDYAFQLLGADLAGNRIAALGRLRADGYGHVTGGSLDLNDGTSLQANQALSGSYSVSGSNGRGTMSLTIGSLGTFGYVVYVLSADRSFLTSVDAVSAGAPQLCGEALKQSGGPFSDASLLGPGVFEMLGRPAAGQAVTAIGLFTGDGAGHITGTADINANGTVSEEAACTATYTVAANGRGTLTSSTLPNMVFHMVGPGRAFLMEAAGGAVRIGSLEPQTPLPYGPALLLGRFVEGGSVPPPYAANETVTAVLSFYDYAADTFTYVADYNSSAAGLGYTTGEGKVAAVASNGRVVFTDANNNSIYAYLVSPGKFVEILGDIPQLSTVDRNLIYKNIRRP